MNLLILAGDLTQIRLDIRYVEGNKYFEPLYIKGRINENYFSMIKNPEQEIR
jgi:hypothetical protein